MKIIRLEPKHFNETAKTIENAFIHQRLLTQAIPNIEQRRLYLKYTAPMLLNYGYQYGKIFSFEDFKGVSVWLNPGEFPFSFYKLFKCNQLAAFFKLPWKATLPLFKINRMMNVAHSEVMTEDHWWLYLIAVDPDLQNKGLGKLLLEALYKEADNQGRPYYANASDKSVTHFLGKSGFKVVKKVAFPGNLSSYGDIYALVRRPNNND